MIFFRQIIFIIFFVAATSSVLGTKYVLKDGQTFEGRHANIARVDEKADELGKITVKLITVIDDGLRRIYVPKYNIAQILEEGPAPVETFRTNLKYAQEGQRIEILGDFDNSVPFDQFGRRLLSIRHPGGTDYFSQAITELNSRYLRVRGIHRNNTPLVWDMRIATASVPREQLEPILMGQINPEKIDDRIRLVRFYYGGKLYEEATEELFGILEDWKDDPEARDRLAPMYRMIEQQRYQRRIDELELRWKGGQHELVWRYLKELESDESLPAQLFESVRRMLQRYNDFEKKKASIIAQLETLYGNLSEEEKDPRLFEIIEEIRTGLTLNTIDRLSTFLLFSKDATLNDSEKLALGLTGWFAGSGADNRRLTIAAAFPETRQLITDYLLTQNGIGLGGEEIKRKDILEKLRSLESARPDLVAKIIATLDPPKREMLAFDPDKPGYFHIAIDNPIAGTVEHIEYSVQLPPEYDPKRRYPMIVALGGNMQSPDYMLDWWSGIWRGKERIGHAARNGYIVIVPDWNPAPIRQFDYDFSAFPHAAVLFSVKDAFRRFSVDTDRVFLSGHGIGGTAAWDIGLAHPDIWAGVIPFNAVASKHITAYKSNVKQLPFYFVWGELEGVENYSKLEANAVTLNRYLAQQAKPNNVVVSRLIGRGVENFSDEILNVFDWMKMRERNVNPIEFEVNTIRPWDNFFWWVEMNSLEQEKPDYVRDPLYWSDKNPPKNMITVTSKIQRDTNSVQTNIAPRLNDVTVFLTPDIFNFGSKGSVKVNEKSYLPPNGFIEPDIWVILEDARTRSDRKHPFWARLTGRK